MENIEIDIENEVTRMEIEEGLANCENIEIKSIDEQDKDATYIVNKSKIISISEVWADDDTIEEKVLRMFWRHYSFIEGKNHTNSATFQHFDFK